MHDTLTGLPNRQLLNDRLQQAVRSADRTGESVALLMVDLDGFKEVNDTLGHHFGDLVLQTVATRLASVARRTNTVARLGGDEFAVLLPEIGSAAEAETMAGRLLEALRRPAVLDGVPVDIDGSIGVALHPVHSANATQLVQQADVAMYTAKRQRLGTFMFDPAENNSNLHDLSLLADLRQALTRAEILVHYQPKINAESDQVGGVEALVRWQHPDHGILLPEEFISLAEGSALIERLTHHVLGTALDQCQHWLADRLRLPVSVNVTARPLLNPAFPHLVTELLAQRSLSSDLLTLEVPEKVFRIGNAMVLETLVTLGDRGVRISVDDPADSAAIEYLRAARVHEMKIAPEVVGRISVDGWDESAVRAVLDPRSGAARARRGGERRRRADLAEATDARLRGRPGTLARHACPVPT